MRCVCMYVCVCVCVYVCVCVCVCVFTSIHREDFICLDLVGQQRTDQRCYVKDVVFLCQFPSSLLQNAEPNLSTLSCSHTRSGQSHDLTSVCLTFRTRAFIYHSASVAFSSHYIVTRSTLRPDTHEGVRNLSMKG